jgi:hypothetical protein
MNLDPMMPVTVVLWIIVAWLVRRFFMSAVEWYSDWQFDRERRRNAHCCYNCRKPWS